MKERPVLFSGDMVRAILSGRKTQTRRVRGLEDINHKPSAYRIVERSPDVIFQDDLTGERLIVGTGKHTLRCPYGGPGDRLWVRETWGIFTRSNSDKLMCVWYKASGLNSPVTNVPLERRFPEIDAGLKLHPSIFMPKKYARIWLEITEVRVQRVQEITPEDVLAEGIMASQMQVNGFTSPDKWCELWDSINAKRGYSWESNPWVFAISFKRVD